ncbi:MAG TPA: hypothetical protein VF183_07220 [Acidimicrobiales bacterium]
MGFDPLGQRGVPVSEQVLTLAGLAPEPYDKATVDPYTRTRVILMNGIEVESVLFSHQFARHTDDVELKRALALCRRMDQLQQKVVNGLNPGDQTVLETTLGYEQVAVDLTAWLARHEPDPYLKQCLDFALLEDFDHLYRYADLYDLIEGKKAEAITGHLTEVMPGRPTALEHRHPFDEIRRHVDTFTVHPLSRLHVMTIVAAEQQTMNFYMNHAADYMEPIVRALYSEIAMIEEQHVTHYESLLDPIDSWLRQWVFHEYNEIYLYWSMHQQESDRRIRDIWERHLDMEIGQLQLACEFLQRYEGTDPREILPASLPEVAVTFEPNKQYVRDILATQIDLRADGLDFVPLDQLPADHRYFDWQRRLGTDQAPSEHVVTQDRAHRGTAYRDQTEGEHPIPALREPARV